MRIGINLSFLLPGSNGGVETYAVSTLRALASQDRSNEYFVFVNRLGAKLSVLEASNITPVVCAFDARVRELRYAWEQFVLPRQARRYGLDLLHSPGYQGPLLCPCPTVVTLPDVNFVAFGDVLPFNKRVALRFFCSRAARRAAHLITISHFSKQQIIEHLGVPEENITVTHLGPGILPEPAEWGMVRARYHLPGNYIVAFAGNNYPHKNLPRLFEAFARVRATQSVHLAIIGTLSSELRNVSDLKSGVLDLGYVEGEHISTILGHARLCVVPSLYEGFGLPVLEAQSAGVPLACSNAASLPEVAGEGASFFDPRSVGDMALAIEQCLGDPSYCDLLLRRAAVNLNRFSWAKTADETLEVYNRILGGVPSVVPEAGSVV